MHWIPAVDPNRSACRVLPWCCQAWCLTTCRGAGTFEWTRSAESSPSSHSAILRLGCLCVAPTLERPPTASKWAAAAAGAHSKGQIAKKRFRGGERSMLRRICDVLTFDGAAYMKPTTRDSLWGECSPCLQVEALCKSSHRDGVARRKKRRGGNECFVLRRQGRRRSRRFEKSGLRSRVRFCRGAASRHDSSPEPAVRPCIVRQEKRNAPAACAVERRASGSPTGGVAEHPASRGGPRQRPLSTRGRA